LHDLNIATYFFSVFLQFEIYILLQSDGRKGVYACPFCPKILDFKSHLDRHLLKHTGERPFPCKYCNRSFSQKGNLKTHVQKMHNDMENP
jgi:uncharacterized Zn-finger protein